MAEKSSSIASGSPIMNLAQDHLFSILLLLPTESILSFSMTCRRFRQLASSDPLWEAVCKREWGPSTVDALKPAAQIPWVKLFKQVSRLSSVFVRKLSDPDEGSMVPRPRASHSLNFVSDRMVLFGGGCDGGRHLDDTWVAYIGNDYHRTLKWKKVYSGTPSGRFGHTCIAIGDFLVLFGGINDHGDRQNDTWIGQVSSHEKLSWRLLDVGSKAPPPRGAHAACCIHDRKMVIHGGIGLNGVRIGDTWILELSENLTFGIWHEILTHVPSPLPRSGHTLTSIRDNQSVLFGGRGLGYDVLNDVWLLDIQDGREKWIQILYEFQNIPERALLPRVGHSATLILGRILIYGGEDSNRHRKDDFWVLDTNAIPCHGLEPPAINLEGLLEWKRLKGIGYKPKARSFHRACVDHTGSCIYVFGGMVDGLIQPAATSGLRFDGDIFMVELALNS